MNWFLSCRRRHVVIVCANVSQTNITQHRIHVVMYWSSNLKFCWHCILTLILHVFSCIECRRQSVFMQNINRWWWHTAVIAIVVQRKRLTKRICQITQCGWIRRLWVCISEKTRSKNIVGMLVVDLLSFISHTHLPLFNAVERLLTWMNRWAIQLVEQKGILLLADQAVWPCSVVRVSGVWGNCNRSRLVWSFTAGNDSCSLPPTEVNGSSIHLLPGIWNAPVVWQHLSYADWLWMTMEILSKWYQSADYFKNRLQSLQNIKIIQTMKNANCSNKCINLSSVLVSRVKGKGTGKDYSTTCTGCSEVTTFDQNMIGPTHLQFMSQAA